MSKFSVGEIAIGQNFINSPYLNGEELVINSAYGKFVCSIYNGEPCSPPKTIEGYMCIKPDGCKTCLEIKHLRKKKPPKEEASWKQIEELTNWHPERVEA